MISRLLVFAFIAGSLRAAGEWVYIDNGPSVLA
jgi:hypothetical protein